MQTLTQDPIVDTPIAPTGEDYPYLTPSTLLLPNVTIQNYRLFDDLTLDDLKRINVIVGENNTGKTCLLEALWLFARHNDPTVLTHILTGDNESSALLHTRNAALASLFHGMPPLELGNEPAPITIATTRADGEQETVAVDVGWYDRHIGNKDDLPLHRLATPLDYTLAHHPVMLLRVQHNGQASYYNLDHLPPNGYSPTPAGIPSVFVHTPGVSPTMLALLWSTIAVTEAEETIAAALRLIEPRVKRVGMKMRGQYPSIPFVSLAPPAESLNGQQESVVPLRTMGAGINRMFAIILALVNAQDGLLLVDEIDTGFHYIVLVELWRIILRHARQHNIQVFATTHSWDCLNAVRIALRKERESISDNPQEELSHLVRLDRKQDKIVPVSYDEEELQLATREHLEVR
jgi:predicted ATPase